MLPIPTDSVLFRSLQDLGLRLAGLLKSLKDTSKSYGCGAHEPLAFATAPKRKKKEESAGLNP